MQKCVYFMEQGVIWITVSVFFHFSFQMIALIKKNVEV